MTRAKGLGEIIGHEAPIELLQRARRSERLPHALLFQGPESVGKGTVARAMAAAMLCEAGAAQMLGAPAPRGEFRPPHAFEPVADRVRNVVGVV